MRAQAIDLAYNLDHDKAIDLLRRSIELTPNDTTAHRNLASILWLNMLFRRGAVTVDHYLGSFTKAKVDLSKPPPDIDAEFRSHMETAIALAETAVAAEPRSARAHYDLGAAVGLRASYMATVEGKLMAGFKAAKRCFDTHERVLELDPKMTEAGLIVGTYRYIVATLPWHMRVLAYVVGFGGDKELGIKFMEGATAGSSSSGSDVSADAMFGLILIYNREKRYDDALRVMQRLRDRFPRNRLVVLEMGATALRAGRAQQAEALLADGLAMLARETRPRIPGEEALWRYKRGAARAALGRADAALADLRAATGGDAQDWVQGRARVEIGHLALARGDRATAASEARLATSLCKTGNDPACVDSAGKLLRKANGR